MTDLAIIGGTGLGSLAGLDITNKTVCRTPYGEPSGPLIHGQIGGRAIVFLARHGPGHTIPPHKINYRANIWALHELGTRHIIAINAVGGIAPDLHPGRLAFPNQIIDYTWSRGHTFFEDDTASVTHIDFTSPYCEHLRSVLIRAASQTGIDAVTTGVYGATQGPRLETAAEIDRMDKDGCTMVGMTGMPEAALARELHMNYAACAAVANWAAGRGAGVITMQDIEAQLKKAMQDVRSLLEAVIPLIENSPAESASNV
jgi:5'-deoxy-5'-methylthioadenosine phosphorylase